jgi:hypothetical protein
MASRPMCLYGGRSSRELSGGKRMVAGPSSLRLALGCGHPLPGALAAPPPLIILASGPRDPLGPQRPMGEQIVTWLILPVVICLSQRLSHACLSISNYTVKLRMAH